MKLSRRAMLRGFGAAVSLPFLDAMRVARASEPVRQRLVWFWFPNGIETPMLLSASDPETGFAMPSIYSPLEALRSDTLVLSGLYNPGADTGGDAGHPQSTATTLTSSELDYDDINGSINQSVDQRIASELGAPTFLPSLVLGSEGSPMCPQWFCDGLRSISWQAQGVPAPKDTNVSQAFQRLFGDGTAASEQTRWEREVRRRSVLDFVLDDAQRLHTKLGIEDRARLEGYLDGIRELERRMDVVAASCETPESIASPYAVDDHVRAMVDLMVLALKCDRTRIISYMIANGGSIRVYGDLGQDEPHHTSSHDPITSSRRAKMRQVHHWTLDHVVRLATALRNEIEGDRTLLEQTGIVCLSGMGDGYRHTVDHVPTVILGQLGGAIRTGRHLWADGHTLGDLHLSLGQAMGLNWSQFGVWGRSPLAL